MGKKKLFLISEIPDIKMPRWPEFALKDLWEQFDGQRVFIEYMPEGWNIGKGGRTPEKNYVWTIICKLEQTWIRGNIDRIRDERALYK